MTVDPMKGPYIQAAGYSQGKSTVRLIVLHTAEGAKDEIELGNFFHGTTAGSSNAGVGQDGGYAQYVNYSDTAWTNPPVNANSDTLEMCGFAAWSRSTWLQHTRMLDAAAHWVAWRAAVRQIPIKRVTGHELAVGKGVCAHIDVNNVYHDSEHWDCGPNFPWDYLIGKAAEIASVPTGPARPDPAPGGPRWMHRVHKHDTLSRIAVQYRTYVPIIMRMNDLTDDRIKVGQKLKVIDNRYWINLAKMVECARDEGKAAGVVGIQRALDKAGMIRETDPDGRYGPATRRAYRRWQEHLGYTGNDANGIPGEVSLARLGRRAGFYVNTED